MTNISHLAHALLSTTTDAMLICAQDKTILQINPAFEHKCGYLADEIVGKDLWDLLNNTPQSLQTTLSEGHKWSGEIDVTCKDDLIKLMSVNIHPVLSEKVPLQALEFEYTLVSFHKISNSRKINQHNFDDLTKLPSYHLFVDRIEQSLIAAPRIKKSVALLIIGLDRFVMINDGLGYTIGDHVLRAVAGRLEKTIRRSDTVARLDGDKFGLVMQITSVEDSVIVAEKLLKALSETINIEEQHISVTASIGISIFPTDGSEQKVLINNAERAMRHTKKQGGNHYQFFSHDLNLKAKSRIEMEHNLRRALKNNEFLVYYQPKVNLEDNAIVGAEALVRWQDPEKGLISPGEFIPIAEETGIISDIGQYVLYEACRQNSAWQKKGFRPLLVSVNVTASQFREKDLVEKVKQVLHKTKLPAKCLELELTESMLIGNIEQVIEKLQVFRDMGIHISIDDFGTGYSSLSYLNRFPITTLKIDRAFIKDMETNANTAEITSAIIGLSHGLSLDVVAEGAENIEHIEFLRNHGCDLVQGFFYSRPLPPKQFEKLLEHGYLYDYG